jgi:hypothetical protein
MTKCLHPRALELRAKVLMELYGDNGKFCHIVELYGDNNKFGHTNLKKTRPVKKKSTIYSTFGPKLSIFTPVKGYLMAADVPIGPL